MRYFEDFRKGDQYRLATVTVDADEMIEFARRFDPQPFHVDAELARESPFGGLIAMSLRSRGLFGRRTPAEHPSPDAAPTA